MLNKWILVSPDPLRQSAKDRILDDARRRQYLARKKMSDLAELILNEPKVGSKRTLWPSEKDSDVAVVRYECLRC